MTQTWRTFYTEKDRARQRTNREQVVDAHGIIDNKFRRFGTPYQHRPECIHGVDVVNPCFECKDQAILQ